MVVMKSISSAAAAAVVGVSRDISRSSNYSSSRHHISPSTSLEIPIFIFSDNNSFCRHQSFKHANNTARLSSVNSSSGDEVSTIVSAASDPDISWQIIVGALAGVIPFVVAAIEFSKRILAQKKCDICQGSGLVLRDNKYYFRCPSCGGFLPWQSWKRFFSG